jgi:hypothetical protein
MFDCERPTLSDPFVEGRALKWTPSSEPQVHYFWSQAVPIDISFDPKQSPAVIDCEYGNTLEVYSLPSKIEILYRLRLVKPPNRFLRRPFDHAIYWTYGTEGGPSKVIKYLYKDKNLSINKWVDKDSFLSVVRTNHFANYDLAFWSR